MNHLQRPTKGRFSKRRPQLLTTTAHIRSVEVTPLGHLSCVLETPSGEVNALSDAVSVHQPELVAGTTVQVVLLSLYRASDDAPWQWQLLCARAARTETTHQPITAGSQQ